ncbi:hypothetical protein [Stieleria varia]|nr:hypothetical protein [Stieleria varia]
MRSAPFGIGNAVKHFDYGNAGHISTKSGCAYQPARDSGVLI